MEWLTQELTSLVLPEQAQHIHYHPPVELPEREVYLKNQRIFQPQVQVLLDQEQNIFLCHQHHDYLLLHMLLL